MTHDQMPDFVKLLTALSLSYSETLNEFAIERYWQTLERFEFSAVKTALEALTIHNPDRGYKMPEASDVLRYLEGSTQVKALQAWGYVLKVIRCVGSYQSIVFDDPILHQVIDDMGGWIRLCETTVRELNFLGQTFQKLYATYALNPSIEYPKKLPGRFDTDNPACIASPPLLLGDQSRAALVYQKGGDSTSKLCQTSMLPQSAEPVALPAPSSQVSEE